MKVKGRTQYWVDLVIALGFVLSAVSGIVLYLAPSGGFQGGRNPAYDRAVLFIARDVWKSVHTWSSFVMTAGVLLHLVLHWEWITCTTRNIVRRARSKRPEQACETQA